MTKFTKQVRQRIGTLCVVILMLFSCVHEADIEIANPEIRSTFDSKLTEVLEVMGDNSVLALEKLDNLISEAELINSKYYSGKAKWYKGYIYDEVVEDVSMAYHNYNEALKDIL